MAYRQGIAYRDTDAAFFRRNSLRLQETGKLVRILRFDLPFAASGKSRFRMIIL